MEKELKKIKVANKALKKEKKELQKELAKQLSCESFSKIRYNDLVEELVKYARNSTYDCRTIKDVMECGIKNSDKDMIESLLEVHVQSKEAIYKLRNEIAQIRHKIEVNNIEIDYGLGWLPLPY
tara:strand:+ start:337 stop:708 length:372 start_codon:yes stop_codon:yes gene_type:complete